MLQHGVGHASGCDAQRSGVVIGPPVKPAPLATLVTLPVPGKVWPATKVTAPVLLIWKALPLRVKTGCVRFGNSVSVSRTAPVPLTSRVAAGVVVAMPMLLLAF